MAVYRIYPEKDAFITSDPNTAGLYPNAGRDEILEIGGFPDSSDAAVGRTNRSLIQFKTSDITSTISNKVSGSYSASLHLYLANASEIPTSFSIKAHPISSSWTEGTGKSGDDPINRTGVSWKFKDAATTEWTSLGCDFLNTTTGSQNFTVDSNYDINLDLSAAVSAINAETLDNNGFLLKLEDSYENYLSSSIKLNYFGKDSNTIFPPYLEFKWDDSTYNSSLTELDSDIATVSIKNHKEKYIDSDTIRFNIFARPKYPTRTFTTSSIYLTNYKLPEESYWGIKDEFSDEMIIDFDTNYTKISANNDGSYFDVYMDSLQPERHYRLLIKTTLNNSTVVLDDKNIFKVVRNG